MADASALGYGDVTVMKENLAVLAVGAAINGALFGVFSGQVAFYLRYSYHGDRPFLRGVISAVIILNILHLVLYVYTAWVMLVTAHAAVYDSLDAGLPWSTYAQIFLNSIAVLVIQTFYAHRVWKIGRSIGAIVVLGFLILCTFAGGIVLFTYTLLAVRVTELYLEVVHIEKAVNIMFAITDFALTSCLLCVLIRSNEDGPSPLVKQLAFYTLSTGVLTCVSALAGIILIFCFPDSIMSTIIWYTAASLYSTSLMASLNAREKLRRRAGPSVYTHSHMTEALLTNHTEIVMERRSDQSYVDVEKQPDTEKGKEESSSGGGSVSSDAVATENGAHSAR
ncbi:hypothetical protein L227DRAFT_608715 [Lentinus tigrinus ALCF2SS1-6]|uniref:DUF6534 domain-containing protein n=1 Tax=Lentinus tigrinus ALCF2SS1-6 TaxID=1328759 RepID=A0A5C2SIG1_9APHY|nr:hypothetical protein L227DRAFT_608715 [Lentinus tigrinus ALCF2SS1-6]